jgi:acetyl esterase/lipase
MKWAQVWIATIAVALVVGSAMADEEQVVPGTKPAKTPVYKTIGDVKLQLHVFLPPEGTPANAPAIVFFFGGGWTGGKPTQFYEQCKYFASRGMVAISAEYRIKSLHGTSAVECVKDGKSAIRWVRAHAADLGVDPAKIVAGGGSAGGHVAACTGVIEGFEDENEDRAVSSRPAALVLFNPVLEIPEKSQFVDRFQGRQKDLSPLGHVAKGCPPTIVFHGTADSTVPFASVERFRDKMKEAGNICEVVPFEGEKHGFFNFSRNRKAFDATMAAADAFLVAQGILKPAAPERPAKKKDP